MRLLQKLGLIDAQNHQLISSDTIILYKRTVFLKKNPVRNMQHSFTLHTYLIWPFYQILDICHSDRHLNLHYHGLRTTKGEYIKPLLNSHQYTYHERLNVTVHDLGC
ncbi:hypothetical protein V6Z12_A10G081700 [Gossypium hirsutum]